jgi:serine palmitoyltransferase
MSTLIEPHYDPYLAVVEACFVLCVFYVYGYLRDNLRYYGFMEQSVKTFEKNREGYVGLYNSFENFFRRNFLVRGEDLFNVPICSMAGPEVELIEREFESDFKLRLTGTTKKVINMTSYNYLEMNQREGPTADAVIKAIKDYGPSVCAAANELGTTVLQTQLERKVAEFIGVEDALTVGMGFATNTTMIPGIITKDCLIISDEFNHASIALGCKLSGCVTKRFRHNNMNELEGLLREGILYGNPRTRRSYKKILIIVEGVYSMEGTIVHLPEVIRLKKKYKAFLYLDEAHSIGSVGPTGRGVCEYMRCDPRDVDLMMGTFTKSFGAAGGYVAGKKEVINYLRQNCAGAVYGRAMSPAVVQQIISSFDVLANQEEGKTKLRQLKQNTQYFRRKMQEEGFYILGHEASPVVPMMVYNPVVAMFIARELRNRGIGSVMVGFPATELAKNRIRFCLSAGHTRQMLDYVIQQVIEVGRQARVYKVPVHLQHGKMVRRRSLGSISF